MLKTPSIFPQWWTLWIINGLIGRVIMKGALKAEELDELIIASQFTMLADLLYIPLCIIAIKLLSDIYTMQNKNR